MNDNLDGNVAGGILQEVFPFEMTTALGTCAGCGMTKEVGALSVYMHGMGMVIRCPDCDHVLIRVVRAKGEYWLDMQGLRVLRLKASM